MSATLAFKGFRALMAAAPLVFSTGAMPLGADFAARVLAAHNLERSVTGVEPMHWNAALASDAKRWAEHLASSGRFEHASEHENADEGENIWGGTPGRFAPEAMVSKWVEEKRVYKRGRFPDVSLTGNYEDVGHYTQVVWRDTNEIGCAKADGADETILVCRYARAGNVIGEYAL